MFPQHFRSLVSTRQTELRNAGFREKENEFQELSNRGKYTARILHSGHIEKTSGDRLSRLSTPVGIPRPALNAAADYL